MALTKDQSLIIAAETDDILVSAAAGSGKTFTMTHRIVERVKSQQLSMDKVLVLTFTDKAANSMYARMGQVLHDAVAEASGALKQYLMEQEMRLSQAQVSTIHSFCYKILGEHGALLGQKQLNNLPDAAANVMDDETQKRLLAEAIDLCLQDAYASVDEAYLAGKTTPDALIWQLNDVFGDAKGDEPLRVLLAQIYNYLRSMPDYDLWTQDALEEYRQTYLNFQESATYKHHISLLKQAINRALEGVSLLRPYLTEADPPLFYAMKKFNAETYAKNDSIRNAYLDFLLAVEHLANYISNESAKPDWNRIFALGQEMDLPNMIRRGNDPDKLAIIDISRAYLAELAFLLNGSCYTDAYKPFFQFAKRPVFTQSQDAICEELAAQDARLGAFFAILFDIDKRYAELKAESNALDYPDMEHFALQLVRIPEVKQYYQSKFSEIYIDEYQDTSSIQNAIVEELSNKNVFIVGDVKQSIYRFRHANPRLFADRYAQMKADASQSLFELSTNFRSTPAVLRAINNIFSEIMTLEASEIDYLAGHELGIPEFKLLADEEAAGDQESTANQDAAFKIFCFTDSRDEFDKTGRDVLLAPSSAEGLCIANEIVRLIDSGVAAQDIAVLSRKNSDLSSLASILTVLGIEYSFSKEERVLESVLLRTVIAVLRLIENPLQDNYLATALLHLKAWGGFTVHEFLSIKRHSMHAEPPLPFETPFHETLRLYCESGPDEILRERLNHFFDSLNSLRNESLSKDLTFLLTTIYEDLGILESAASEPDSALKIKQLEEFAVWAEAFVKPGKNALYALNKELEAKDDKIILKSEEKIEELHGVQLMTFHGSKGLEFPHVFICRAVGKMSNNNIDKLIYSQSFGLAPEIADDGNFEKHTSIVQHYIADKENAAELAEHLRLIYVALTRAERSIYMTVSNLSFSKALEFIESNQEQLLAPGPAPSWLIKNAANLSLIALIMLGISSYKGASWPALSQEITSLIGKTKEPSSPEQGAGQDQNELLFDDYAIVLRDSTDIFKPSSLDVLSAVEVGSEDIKASQDMLLAIYIDENKKNPEHPFWQLSYPYPDATLHGIKYSVSEIKDKVYQDALVVDESQDGLSQMPMQDVAQDVTSLSQSLRDATRVMRPLKELLDDAGHSTQELSATERGSLQHKILRYLRPAVYAGLTPLEAQAQLQEDLASHKENGLLTAVELTHLEEISASLLAFLCSDLAAEIARCDQDDPGTLIYREIPFTLAWTAKDLLKGEGFATHDKVLVQGIVDLWYRIDARTTVVDFKSDRISGDDAEVLAELKKRYATQLAIYAQAVERESGAPVDAQIIWLLSRDKAYTLA